MLEKTFSPSEVENRRYAAWEEEGHFAAGSADNAADYCIVIPPPNVTGSLHMGHALNSTLQDIMIRLQRMRGHNVLWQPGTDHAGIATQMVVERDLEKNGIKRQDLGREAFVAKVWDWKAESGGIITGQLRRLGASCDWQRERFTMDEGLSRAVTKVFVELYKKQLIYKDFRLVNWDPKLKTAISDLEVVQQEVKGQLWHFNYPIEGEAGRFITVATTRPETMLGDTAIAVHPDDARFKDLVGKFAILPLVNRRLIIVADDYADPEQGSGAVKITPAHDFNDFEVGRRHDLEMINIFDENAHLNDNVPVAYRGLERFAARKKIIADMAAAGLLVATDEHLHTVPYGDRGNVPIEPWLTEQWYADAATLAKPALEAVETGKTVFVPKNHEKTYYEWMRNIKPWCISRQLWWGHQIPAWYGPDETLFVEHSEAEALAAAATHYGREVELRRDPDVLDTWFSSALWPFSTLGWPDKTAELARYYPTSLLVTGHDIIFFWVARMMMMGLHFMGEVPFRTVYIHALVRDEQGQKMSKSKGNVIDPLDLIDTYGADALRFTLASQAAMGRDVKLSESRVAGNRNFATKLWNAARFCELNKCILQDDFVPNDVSSTLNKWIIGETANAFEQVTKDLEDFRFNDAANGAYHFVWGTFCDWYLELAKPMLQGDNAAQKQETRKTTAWVLSSILRLLHPFMPFVTEELWGHLGPGERDPLIVSGWLETTNIRRDPAVAAEVDWMIRLIGNIRSVRTEMNVPAGARIEMYLDGANAESAERLARQAELIQRLARLSCSDILNGPQPAGSVQTVIDEATVVLPLADVIDMAVERARLEKERASVAGNIQRLDGKLSNEKFISRAPEHVVTVEREKKAAAEQTLQKLDAALARLAG